MYLDYIRHFFRSVGKHHLHSPFLFDFYTKVYTVTKSDPKNLYIEKQRLLELKNDKSIQILDLGAGSKISSNKTRKINDIVRKSTLSGQKASFLQRIIEFYNYKNILELGSSVGFTTAYLANASTSPIVHTLEGCPKTLTEAKRILNNLELKNITFLEGNIDNTLSTALKFMTQPDFVFFDANHSYEATINYFEKCLAHKTVNSCFVFDDIYWSEGMKKAWKEISENNEVSISIDTFYFGIVFFRKGIIKQHFYLK